MALYGYIYFVKDEECNLIKIGLSANPYCRIVTSRAINPHRLVLLGAYPGSRSEEHALHKKFNAHRVGENAMEWFQITEELLDLIRAKSWSLKRFKKTFPFILNRKFRRLGCEPLAVEWLKPEVKTA